MRKTIYDIEIYANVFLLVAKQKDTGVKHRFRINPWHDEREELIRFLREETELMIGFNNLSFDYPLLHYFIRILYKKRMKGREIVTALQKKANDLIQNKKQFRNMVYHPLRKQLDLLKIHHFDNKAKMTSLKVLEFNMRLQNVQELPFKPGSVLTEEECIVLEEYCCNDVDATDEFFDKTSEEIKLREELGVLYGQDMTNFNDPKIGQEIFRKIIQKEMGIEKIGSTPREKIDLVDCIFESISFRSVEFNLLLNWMKSRTIRETKGAFTELPFTELESLEGHYVRDVKKGKQKNLNVLYKGFRYDFGLGGIHGSVIPGVYEMDDEYLYVDIDVKSYYPNLGIKNRLRPAHLGDSFPDIYEGVYIKRQEYPKKHPANKGLKLGLNGVFGKSNSEYSPFYDPMYTMAITVNGQLLLCMLSEKIVDDIPRCQMIQMNTDGMTVKVHKDDLEQFRDICWRWENYTKLELEEQMYEKMIIRDVNNYSALKMRADRTKPIDPMKDIKRKGAFTYLPGVIEEREWHKDHSMLVVPRAVEQYFYHNVLPEEFIPKWEDTFDFFKRVKLDKRHQLQARRIEEKEYIVPAKRKNTTKRLVIQGIMEQQELPNLTRFYVGKEGMRFIKMMPPIKKSPIPRENEVEAGWLSVECNDLRGVDMRILRENINYDYYIHEARKIISAIESGQEIEGDDVEEAD